MRFTSYFPWILWNYTQADESLFDLSSEELFVFSSLVKCAESQ